MTRNLALLGARRFDVLVIGGGIHGLAVAYDAAQRGLTTALIDRGDFGSGSSFNHAKTVHGGLRSLQTGDIPKARFSMRERRAMARVAPSFVRPLSFMMGTTRKLTRSKAALRIGFALDALVGHDRDAGVAPSLHLPAGQVVSVDAYRATFGANASPSVTGGARWFDYQMPESDRLSLAFARAATDHGAVLANYVEAVEPIRRGDAIAGVRARDGESETVFDIEARLVVNAAGAACRDWIARLGGRLNFPLIKATNVVTTKPAGPSGLGAPTSSGRLLLIMPWRGVALIGTSHSDTPVEAGDSYVTSGELAAFIDEINSAFPALHLTAADVSLVHRGVVPAERGRQGTLGLMGHHIVYDHLEHGVAGAISVVGVKYTTARGVGEQVVDLVAQRLSQSLAPCRTGTTLLPGVFAHTVDEECERAVREAQSLLPPHSLSAIVQTHGTCWRAIADLCLGHAELAEPLDPAGTVPAAVAVYAVREEMARTVLDVLVRRTNLGSAGFPGEETARRCAAVLARELGWTQDRVAAELAAVRRFYEPAGAAPEAGGR
ncbi:MAG: FAD-dependent oxidoreductase [Vicinamibacterales bacterium]|nr:FAD-dependent oxidoreductase [Vicinamibacterales bacterium]